MKNFVKALDTEAFQYLVSEFPEISDGKLKAGIFVRPQIRRLLMDSVFATKLVTVEMQAWEEFRKVVDGFLGNKKSPTYEVHVKDDMSFSRSWI